MGNNRLLLLPLFVGLILMIYSWWASYPLAANSVQDPIFNHVSPIYWISLPLTLTSMLLIAFTSRNAYMKWIMTIGIVITMYSISYFYSLLPTVDSQYVRGLNEFLVKTQNLSFFSSGKVYFQWPCLFVFTYIASVITGLHVTTFEFLGYTVIGFIAGTAVYVYSSRFFRNGGFLLVIAFFAGMYYYLNYQYESFMMAFSLLLLLLALDVRQKNPSMILTMLVLFVSMVFMHLFVPVFFIIYLLIRYVVSKNKQYGVLFLICSVFYLLVSTTYSLNGFFTNISNISRVQAQNASPVTLTVQPIYYPIDAIAQRFSTIVLIITVVLCAAGFFFLLIKRKLRDIDKAILVTGIVYAVPGFFVFLLGYRSIPLVFLPFCLGVPYIFQTKYRSVLIGIVMILLVLFTFIPIHLSFYNRFIAYQPQEGYAADNFFINHYELSSNYSVSSDFLTRDYLQNAIIGSLTVNVDRSHLEQTNIIVYNLAFQNEFGGSNATSTILNGEKLNTLYDNGFSKILMQGYSSK